MTDKDKALIEFKRKGYLILDFIPNEYPHFKELMKFAGAGQGMVRNNLKEISSPFEENGFRIHFLQLPTGENAIYDVDKYNTSASKITKQIKEEVASKSKLYY